MIFGEGVDSEAGTYTVFEEIELSVACPCGRTLRVVVAKKQEGNGHDALAGLLAAHRETCDSLDATVPWVPKVETRLPERKVKFREDEEPSTMRGWKSQRDSVLFASVEPRDHECAQPEKPVERLKDGRGAQ